MRISNIMSNEKSCTFVGHITKLLPLFPYHGCRSYFTVFTSKIGVDKDVIGSTMPFLDSALRVESFSNLIKEFYFKNYSRLAIQMECSAMKRKITMCSNYNDM